MWLLKSQTVRLLVVWIGVLVETKPYAKPDNNKHILEIIARLLLISKSKKNQHKADSGLRKISPVQAIVTVNTSCPSE